MRVLQKKNMYDSDLKLSITNTVLAGCEFTPSSTGDIYYIFQMALTIDSPKITGGEEIVGKRILCHLQAISSVDSRPNSEKKP